MNYLTANFIFKTLVHRFTKSNEKRVVFEDVVHNCEFEIYEIENRRPKLICRDLSGTGAWSHGTDVFDAFFSMIDVRGAL